MDPIRTPEAYDYFRLAGIKSPGRCTLTGAGSPRKWDKADGKGTDGATVTYNGDGLAEFTIHVDLWLPEHFDAFELEFRPMLRRAPEGVEAKAYDIEYPSLAELEISSVVVTNVGQLELTDELGLYSYPISFLQHRKPKPKSATIKGSQGGGGADEPPGAEDELDKQIRQLNADIAAEAKK